MNQGSTDRVPASSLILFSSIAFTLLAYVIFDALWDVIVPTWLLLAVLGLQFAVTLLGSSKVLTQLGAASLSALIAVAACIGAVFLIFPSVMELRIAGGVGGGSALVFILASFVAASRADPVPVDTTDTFPAPEPLIIDSIEEDRTADLVKYGEGDIPGAGDTQDLPLTDEVVPEIQDDSERESSGLSEPPIPADTVYEFDELSESKMGIALGAAAGAPDPEDGDPSTKQADEVQDKDPVEPAIPDDWVEETARSMAYGPSEDTPSAPEADAAAQGSSKENRSPAEPVNLPGIRMRTRYKVLDATSGEHHGTYFGDQGYSTLDTVSLTGLLGPKLGSGELRIVKLDWSNFDEVEVHISVEEVVPIDLDGESAGQPVAEIGVGGGAGSEPLTPEADLERLPEDLSGDESEESSPEPAGVPSGPSYVIYDRRTIQPMGEYVPEGERPRIDRLSLYKMFPEYNFRTFEIDSVRWEEGEVRIFIKGERKSSSKSRDQRATEKPAQRDLLDQD